MISNLKNYLKKILSKRTRAWLRVGIANIYYKRAIRRLVCEQNDVAVLFGCPIHNNLGDHLITLGELKYLEELGFDKTIVQIPKQVYWIYKERIKKGITLKTKIFINGGGWLGDLWPEDDFFMQDIVNTFKNNRIIIFPQTVYYEGKQGVLDTKKKAIQVYRMCKDLTICLRDKASYDFFASMLPCAKVLLLPDIALYVNRWAPKKEYNSRTIFSAGICLRKDKERVDDNKLIYQKILDLLYRKGFKVSCVNTMARIAVPIFVRKMVVNKRLLQFAQKDIIVTDRLHAMIFSIITRTPCIVFDNKSKKVSGVYNTWLSQFEGICPLFLEYDEKVVNRFVNSIIDKKDIEWNFDEINDKFNILEKEIYSG